MPTVSKKEVLGSCRRVVRARCTPPPLPPMLTGLAAAAHRRTWLNCGALGRLSDPRKRLLRRVEKAVVVSDAKEREVSRAAAAKFVEHLKAAKVERVTAASAVFS